MHAPSNLRNMLYLSVLLIAPPLLSMDESEEEKKRLSKISLLELSYDNKQNWHGREIGKLIKTRVDLDVTDKDGQTAFTLLLSHIVGSMGFTPVKQLIKAGARVDIPMLNGDNILHRINNISRGGVTSLLNNFCSHYQFSYIGNSKKSVDIIAAQERIATLRALQKRRGGILSILPKDMFLTLIAFLPKDIAFMVMFTKLLNYGILARIIPYCPIDWLKKYVATITDEKTRKKTVVFLIEKIYQFNKSKWVEILNQKNTLGLTPAEARDIHIKKDPTRLDENDVFKFDPAHFDRLYQEKMKKKIHNFLLDIKKIKIPFSMRTRGYPMTRE